MSPRRALALLALLPLYLAASAAHADEQAGRPNVLLIAIDDLNDWVSCLDGHPDARTPHIDRLAQRGVLFTNAHCQAPICNPSRTSLLYGLRPSTSGVYENSPTPWNVAALKDRVTMPRHFAANGYETLTTGKVYHGSGLPEGDFDVVGPRPAQRIPRDEQIQMDVPSRSRLWDFGQQTYPEKFFPDAEDATWAIEQLRGERDKPFFLAVGFYRPHVPLYAPVRIFEQFSQKSVQLPVVKEDDWSDLSELAREITASPVAPPHEWFVESGKWQEAVAAYLVSTHWTDEQVGRVLDALDNSPHADNTIVVLFSDHGFHLGEKQLWAKRTLWERSTRVPFVIAAPSKSRGRRCSRPVELLSIYPTLIELCGLEDRSDIDGVSIAALLDDPEAPWERPALTTHLQGNHSLRSEHWRYIRYADGSEELYDHRQDPQEWDNLAGDPAHRPLMSQMQQWLPESNADPAKAERQAGRRRGRSRDE